MSFADPIDATGYDFETWIRFAFDHDVSDPPWYYTEEMHFVCDPSRVVTHYTRLFRDPRATLAPFDEGRLEQGLWFIVGSQLSEWLWSEDVALALRLDCIAAMPAMFRELLLDHPLDTTCFMWWDMLRYFGDDPDERVVDAIVRALAEVLQIPATHCQMSALHGLGHLQHGSRVPIIRGFLASHPDLDEEIVRYADIAMSGSVL